MTPEFQSEDAVDKPIGKILHEPTRGELVAIIYDTHAPLRTGSYLTVKLPVGEYQADLLCMIERPFSKDLPPGQVPGARTISLRVVSQLHSDAFALWSLGEAGANVFVPSDEFLKKFFAGNFYSSSKKTRLTAEIPLLVGELRNSECPIRVSLLGEEMNSHTCVLAQSGAGKSYAVGVMLEDIAFNTEANIIVFDPNSDFVRLREFLSLDQVNTPKNDCAPLAQLEYEATAAIHRSMLDRHEIRILGRRGSVPDEDAISIAFNELSRGDRLRILGIDDVSDFSQLLSLVPAMTICDQLVGERKGYTIEELWDVASDILLDRLSIGGWCGGDSVKIKAATDTLTGWVDMHFAKDLETMKAHLALAVGRVRRASGYAFWKKAATERTLSSHIQQVGRRQVMILDLGSFEPGVERATIAAHALETLWRLHESGRRTGEEPVSFVILDEAHHFVPGEPDGEWQERTADLINRIAGEGRKYGLFLIFISQRPSKIHENTFTQADNYWIMRMQNEQDLAAIRKTVRGIPDGILELLPELRRGEALVAGRYIPCPALIRCGRRRTMEGGGTPGIPKKRWVDAVGQPSGTNS